MQILLAEDDDGVAAALVEVLYDHGHVTRRVRYGRDVLTYHRSSDLLLLDLGLPDTDGLDVLRALRAVSDMPVVVLDRPRRRALGRARTAARGRRLPRQAGTSRRAARADRRRHPAERGEGRFRRTDGPCR